MEFTFSNFGLISKGKIEVADLTVICGPNNMGKTYVSYAIYGFVKGFKEYMRFSLSKSQVEELKEKGTIEIDLSKYRQKMDEYIREAGGKFSRDLSEYFSAPTDFFDGTNIDVEFKNVEADLASPFKQIVQFGKSEVLHFEKAAEENIISISLQVETRSRIPSPIMADVIQSAIVECMFGKSLPTPFVITSERTGISLFYKELDINKNAIIECLTENDKVSPVDLINSMRARYAQPIHDNITVIRDYESISKKKSFIKESRSEYKGILDLLKELLGGNFKSEDRQVVYHPKTKRGEAKISIPVYIASSSIKSLFLADLYINCLAKEGGLLIIDEPELNLHPDNQRLMAGLITRLVNAGVKVMVTTHSDYLIRELNNRIMLSNTFEEKESIMRKNGWNKEDILLPNKVKAYCLNADRKIHEMSINQYGIKSELFDKLIMKANEVSEELYYAVGDDLC